MRSDLNRIRTVDTLRTTGKHTGNFGRNPVEAKPGVYEVSKKTMSLDNIKVTDPKEYFTRLAIAYKETNDPKLKKTLLTILKSRAATIRR